MKAESKENEILCGEELRWRILSMLSLVFPTYATEDGKEESFPESIERICKEKQKSD